MIGFDTDLSNFYHFMGKIVISLLSTSKSSIGGWKYDCGCFFKYFLLENILK